MRTSRTRIAFLMAILIAVAAPAVLGRDKKGTAQPTETKRAIHALNRLTFGPRPGDVESVREMGVDKWIELQLHPDKIKNDALNTRLEPLRTLQMEQKDLVENFPPPQVLKQIAEGKMAMPSDPAKRAIYESALQRYQMKKQLDAKGAQAPNPNDPNMSPDDMKKAGEERASKLSPEMREKIRTARQNANGKYDELVSLPPDKRYAEILKMDPLERAMLARSLSPDDRDELFHGMNGQQQETIRALGRPQNVIKDELAEGKILRATYSERQLEEVMTDFWFNHFNVYVDKGQDRYMIASYERDVIRPHVFGKFKDLLLATAKSPAMMFYLDNWQSAGPNSEMVKRGPGGNRNRQQRQQRRGNRGFGGGFGGGLGGQNRRPQMSDEPRQQQQKNRRSGLNENYAREVMELHTLGVDGGYTQKDVTELAKVLTGWTIKNPRQGGGFEFNDRLHEPGAKVVLGEQFKDDGEREGEKALEMLARNPATARFISKKLAMRFVSDNPPAALVDRMATTFTKSDGDIREVLRTMFKSPEFWAPDAYRAKVKTPLEFVVSALRATNADVEDGQALAQELNKMGMPLYGMQPPTGYSMKAETWVNSAALLNRMNTALQLGSGKLRGVTVDESSLEPTAGSTTAPDELLIRLEQRLLNGEVSKQTHATLEKQLADPAVTQRKEDDPARAPNPGVIAGLILGSPEFQKR